MPQGAFGDLAYFGAVLLGVSMGWIVGALIHQDWPAPGWYGGLLAGASLIVVGYLYG